MKKIAFLFGVLFVCVQLFAQTTTIIWSENFQNESVWSETPFPPTGWTVIDQDGDGNNWYWSKTSSGNGYLASRSYLNSNPLTPNNWIITPQIDLTGVASNETVKFEWSACPSANTISYRLEHYGVFISTTNTQPASFTMLFEETFTQQTPNWDFSQRKEIDITQYKGQQVYLAFRHWNVTDMDRVLIDSLIIKKTTPQNLNSTNQSSITIYPNPASDYVNILASNVQKVEIYNNLGQLMLADNKSVIHTAILPEGLYIVKVYADNIVENHRLLIKK